MNKYSWNFNQDDERWHNDTHDTIEDCIRDAKQAVEDGDYQTDDIPTTVYIGENVEFIPIADAEQVLERIEEQACEFAGEGAHDWNAYDYRNQDELNELTDAITNAVIAWMEKYGYTPHFWAVERIRAYPLNRED